MTVTSRTRRGPSMWIRASCLIAGCTVIGMAMHRLLGMARIPYNVKNLFVHDGSTVDLLLFAIATLWIGFGCALAARITAAYRRPWFVLPLATITAALVSYAVVAQSIRQPMIDKFIGTPVTYRDVTESQMWGSGGAAIVTRIATPGLAGAVERMGRYVALYGFFAIWIVVAGAIIHRRVTTGELGTAAIRDVLCGLLPLVLFRTIAFDFPATDNLEELIAEVGPWGLSGTDFLTLLAALIAVTSVSVSMVGRAMPSSTRWSVLIVLVLAIPLGWILFQHAVVFELTRYGSTYAPADFLLGPNRAEKLSRLTLFLRWSVLECALIGVIAIGYRLASSPDWPERPAL